VQQGGDGLAWGGGVDEKSSAVTINVNARDEATRRAVVERFGSRPVCLNPGPKPTPGG
jgi:hypothetical protein